MACHLCLLIFQNHQTQITMILLHCLIVWSLQEPLWKEERKEEEQQIGGVGEEKWVILSFIPYWWNLWKFYQVHWCTWWSKIEISGCFSWNLRQKYAKIISFFYSIIVCSLSAYVFYFSVFLKWISFVGRTFFMNMLNFTEKYWHINLILKSQLYTDQLWWSNHLQAKLETTTRLPILFSI